MARVLIDGDFSPFGHSCLEESSNSVWKLEPKAPFLQKTSSFGSTRTNIDHSSAEVYFKGNRLFWSQGQQLYKSYELPGLGNVSQLQVPFSKVFFAVLVNALYVLVRLMP